MTREDIIRMAREAGFQTGTVDYASGVGGIPYATPLATSTCLPELERFAALVAAAEREKVAAWMMQRGYATGHGDTVEDLLKELEWQVAEREREACAKVCDELAARDKLSNYYAIAAKAIRERSNT